MNPGEQRNILVSIIISLEGSSFLGLTRLITITNSTRKINTMVIRSIKGKSGKAPLVHDGKNLSTVESGIVKIAEVSAAVAVVLFQKNPRRKMERTPGDINPTYSCTN